MYLDLVLAQERDGHRVFACAADDPRVPGVTLQPEKLDSIHTVQSIDWGLNHCVFVDKKNRLFTMGQNRYGKTGLAVNEEQIARLRE